MPSSVRSGPFRNVLVSSHHNLFQEVEGRYPEDKPYMTGIIRDFLALPPEEQTVYQIGRRLGILPGLADMNDQALAGKARDACRRLGVTSENVDQVIDEVMRRFI